MPQTIARRIALRAVQLAVVAAGIFLVMLVFSRQAHAATQDALPPVSGQAASSPASAAGSAVQAAASPVTSAAARVASGDQAAASGSGTASTGSGASQQGPAASRRSGAEWFRRRAFGFEHCLFQRRAPDLGRQHRLLWRRPVSAGRVSGGSPQGRRGHRHGASGRPRRAGCQYRRPPAGRRRRSVAAPWRARTGHQDGRPGRQHRRGRARAGGKDGAGDKDDSGSGAVHGLRDAGTGHPHRDPARPPRPIRWRPSPALTGTLAPVTSTVAPVLAAVIPVLSNVTGTLAPVTSTVAPVLAAVIPVLSNVTGTLAPVTSTVGPGAGRSDPCPVERHRHTGACHRHRYPTPVGRHRDARAGHQHGDPCPVRRLPDDDDDGP